MAIINLKIYTKIPVAIISSIISTNLDVLEYLR